MGGTPTQALLTLAANFAKMDDLDKWFKEFYQALNTEAKKWQVSVCGGDISSKSGKETVFTALPTGKLRIGGQYRAGKSRCEHETAVSRGCMSKGQDAAGSPKTLLRLEFQSHSSQENKTLQDSSAKMEEAAGYPKSLLYGEFD